MVDSRSLNVPIYRNILTFVLIAVLFSADVATADCFHHTCQTSIVNEQDLQNDRNSDYNWQQLQPFAMVVVAVLGGVLLSISSFLVAYCLMRLCPKFTSSTKEKAPDPMVNDTEEIFKQRTIVFGFYSFVVCLLIGLKTIALPSGLGYIALTTTLVVHTAISLYATSYYHFKLLKTKDWGHTILVLVIVLGLALGMLLTSAFHWMPSIVWLFIMVYPYLVRWTFSCVQQHYQQDTLDVASLDEHRRAFGALITHRPIGVDQHEDHAAIGDQFSVGSTSASTVAADENLEAAEAAMARPRNA